MVFTTSLTKYHLVFKILKLQYGKKNKINFKLRHKWKPRDSLTFAWYRLFRAWYLFELHLGFGKVNLNPYSKHALILYGSYIFL